MNDREFESTRSNRTAATRLTKTLDRGVAQMEAREAHNLEAAGSNPAPATNFTDGDRNRRGNRPEPGCSASAVTGAIPVTIRQFRNKNPARSGHRAETLQNHTAIDKELFEAILQNPAGTGNKFSAGLCRFLQEQFYFSPQGDGVIRKGCPRNLWTVGQI